MSFTLTKWTSKDKPSLAKLKKMLAGEGISAYEFVMPVGDYYPEHSHEYDEVRVVVTGAVEFTAEGKKSVLKPGDRLDLVKGTVHTARNIGEEDALTLGGSRR